ncbi:MAG TPA: hypothetical protein VFP59_00315 [Candidatus Angelobacter sp.]|nr:hypothetical protein [Candidatus Angelobacter sp.]
MLRSFRPEVQKAASALGGDGVLRRRKIEKDLAVFDHNGVLRCCKKFLQGPGKKVRIHAKVEVCSCGMRIISLIRIWNQIL